MKRIKGMKLSGIVRSGAVVISLVLSLGVISETAAAPPSSGPVDQMKKVGPSTPPASRTPIEKMPCPDLSVETIGFTLTYAITPLKWQINVWAYIVNKGTRDYVPGPIHRAVMKYDPADKYPDIVIAPLTQNIPVGQSTTVKFPIIWDVAAETTMNRGVTVKLDLSNVPGDTELSHKDCNPNNNQSVTLRGSDISTAIKLKQGQK